MGTSTQCPVFYPLEEGRRSKGKNSLRDWVRNKDYVARKNAPLSVFFFFNDVAGTSPQRFLRRKWVLHLAPPCLGECSDDNPKAGSLSGGTARVFNSDGQMTGPHPSVVSRLVIRCFYTIRWLLQGTCSLNWQWQRWRARSSQVDALIVRLTKQLWRWRQKQDSCLTVCSVSQTGELIKCLTEEVGTRRKTLIRSSWKCVPAGLRSVTQSWTTALQILQHVAVCLVLTRRVALYSMFLCLFLCSLRKWIWEPPQLARSAGLSRWHEQEHAG